jgi:DNA-binding transcriptional LysR family regulator
MLEDLDIRLLRAFAILAHVGSFTRSASLMGVTQSAISHDMKRLETRLGCSLLYKKGKSVHLTPEGRFFLGQIYRVLDAVDRTVESIGKRFENGHDFARHLCRFGRSLYSCAGVA